MLNCRLGDLLSTSSKRLTYESEHGGDGHVRDGGLWFSGLGHPSVHYWPQLLAVEAKTTR